MHDDQDDTVCKFAYISILKLVEKLQQVKSECSYDDQDDTVCKFAHISILKLVEKLQQVKSECS
jgi:hypothetical protein